MKILVGTDFNELSTAALRIAGEIVRRTGGSIHLVYADLFEPPPEFTAAELPAVALSLDEARVRARQELESFAATHLSPEVVRSVAVVETYPADAILEEAARVGADLVALGTHGRGGIPRLLLGSVAETVIRRSPIPVLTTHAGGGRLGAGVMLATAVASEYARTLAIPLGMSVSVAVEGSDLVTQAVASSASLIVADGEMARQALRHASVPVVTIPREVSHGVLRG